MGRLKGESIEREGAKEGRKEGRSEEIYGNNKIGLQNMKIFS